MSVVEKTCPNCKGKVWVLDYHTYAQCRSCGFYFEIATGKKVSFDDSWFLKQRRGQGSEER